MSANIDFYVDHFAIAADAGVDAVRQLEKAVSISVLSDPEEYLQVKAATKNKQAFVDKLRLAEHNVSTFGIDVQYMRESFVGLSKYVSSAENKDLNTYLTDSGIRVSQTFANISRLCGVEIDDTNVE